MAQYNKAVKCLLGVWKNTSNNLFLVESGIQPIQDGILNKRKKILESKFRKKTFAIAYTLCRETNTPGYRRIIIAVQRDITVNPFDKIVKIITGKREAGTKYNAYRIQLHPNLTQHPL